ncbi:MAG: hypothetical protein H0U16_07295, partial [Actinobacteria bacterium]|nr:hypothetical protein [Actinomycetota bacterium]
MNLFEWLGIARSTLTSKTFDVRLAGRSRVLALTCICVLALIFPMFPSTAGTLGLRAPTETGANTIKTGTTDITPALDSVPASDDVGLRDFSYGTGVTAPTGQKPQSKLWWTSGGTWWGVLWSTGAKSWTIQKFDKGTGNWANTGVKVDNRRTAGPDALWDGHTLYIATALKEGSTQTDARVLIYRFSFNGSTWSSLGSPVAVTSGKPETLVLDKDSTGTLWLTFTSTNAGGGKSVYVSHTTSSETTWGVPYVLPLPGADNLSADDISTLVAYGNNNGHYVGVLYSNQNDETLSFARHSDGAGDATSDWERIVLASGAKLPDDHLNIRSLMDDPSGRVFAVVKTSLNDKSPKDPSDPLIILYTITGTSASSATAWRVEDDVTRPILMLDSEHRDVHVFGVAPCCSGGIVYTKSADYNNPSFTTGLGTTFIQLNSDPKINNVTSAKQTVNSTSGLLVEASDDSTRFYVHNFLTLGGNPPPADVTPPDTTIDSGPSGTVTASSANFVFSASEAASTFECRLDDGSWGSCTSPMSYASLQAGSHTFDVRATDAAGNTDQTPASRTWTIASESGIVFSDDFESGALSAWQVATGGDGSAAVQTATVKSGTYAAGFAETANPGSFAYARRAFASP